MKLDVTVNENSPSSPSVDISNPALTPTEQSQILVFHSDSLDDTAGSAIGFPSLTEPAATPATPIFTPTPSSQSQPPVITPLPMSFDTDDQSVKVIDTSILSVSQIYQPVENPISVSSEKISAEDQSQTVVSDISNKSTKADLTPVHNQTRVVSVNITKEGSFPKETNSQAVKKSSRQEESSQSLADTQKNDSYCWSCHEGGNVVCCDSCPRVFHLKCAHIDMEPPEDREWLCAICSRLRSTKRRRGETPGNLTELLGFVLKKLKFEGTEQFQQEVKEEIAPGYRDLVFHPIDLCKIERSLCSYESTLHLRYEVEWLLHNCIIYNGNKHSLSKIARQIVKLCRMELNEIECCANCYKLSCLSASGWFSQVCDPPHSIVMAENKEMRGSPSWPGKLINKGREKCEIRFFGKKHARVIVPAIYVFPLNEAELPNPPPTIKTSSFWPEAMNELKLYQSNLHEWLSLHPYHKMVVPEINENAVFSPPSEKPNSSEENVGDAMGQRTSKSIVKLEEMQPKPAPANPTINTFLPNSDPTPIALFASSNFLPSIPRISNESDQFFSRRVPLKDPFLGKAGPDGQTNHLKSETASDDDNDDPSFDMSRINQKHPGRRKRPGTGIDSKQKSKKIVFSPAPIRGGFSSRGRGKKTENTSRKLLHYQFPPDSLNDELKSNLKKDLLPSVQGPHPRTEPVNELMERNLSLSLKHFDTRSIEENEEEGIHSKFYKMFIENFDSLMLDIIADLNSGQIDQIQKILKEIVTREVSNRNQIYQQVYDNIREDMQRLIEQCHEVAKIEVERQSNQIQMECDRRMDERVRDTKKKTWCSYCWEEAYYNCCWNVNYCSEKCQKIHWPDHKPNCIQMLNTPTPPEVLGSSESRIRQPFETPTSSRDREENQALDIMSNKHHHPLHDSEATLQERKLSVDVMRENYNQEDPFISRSSIPVERDRPPDQKPIHRFTAQPHTIPSVSTVHQENTKPETYPSIIPPPTLPNHYTQFKSALTTSIPTGDSSTVTTPVYVKTPNLSISSSSGQMKHKEQLDQFPRGVRYAPLSISTPHQSPRGQQTSAPVPLASSLSQMETSIPNAIVNNRSMPPSGGLHKESHGAHPAPSTPHKRVRETGPTRAGAQSPHPAVNPVMFSAPIEGHGAQPTSFIIHPGATSVPGAPTTPTSNQAKVLQQALQSQHNLYQLVNGDVQHNFMMRYPYLPTQGQIIPNQGTLQPNPHTMTPRPHDL